MVLIVIVTFCLFLFVIRGSVCNVLLTSCQDGVCRLWAETLLPEDCLLGEQICETTTSSIASNLTHAGRHKDRIQHALEVLYYLRWQLNFEDMCLVRIHKLRCRQCTCTCNDKINSKGLTLCLLDYSFYATQKPNTDSNDLRQVVQVNNVLLVLSFCMSDVKICRSKQFCKGFIFP